jgi:hypothetical protein
MYGGARGPIVDFILKKYFGSTSVFIDIEDIPYGVDYRDCLNLELARCTVLLALVGERWLGTQKDGLRRIDEAGDVVRLEIEGALSCGMPIIPVLVGGTLMPAPDTLPSSIRDFAFRNALKLDPGLDFPIHSERLIGLLEKLFELRAESGGMPFAAERAALRGRPQSARPA